MVAIFLQLIVDGLVMGLVYVLLASGFNLIIGISRILFVAYGEFYMLGAWIVWGLMVPMKLPFLVALCAATLAPAILGGIIYAVIFKFIQFKEQQFLTNIVAAMGLMLLMSQAALFVFGTESRGIPSVIRGMVNLGGIRISYEKVMLIGLTLAVLVGLHLLLQKTKIGRAMRAVSFNPDVAALLCPCRFCRRGDGAGICHISEDGGCHPLDYSSRDVRGSGQHARRNAVRADTGPNPELWPILYWERCGADSVLFGHRDHFVFQARRTVWTGRGDPSLKMKLILLCSSRNSRKMLEYRRME